MNRVIVSEAQRDWRPAAVERLQELVRLKRGWDGYQGQPVKLENAFFALTLLEAICPTESPAPPQIVPGFTGDLQVEWHLPAAQIELQVLAPNRVHAWRLAADGDDPDGESLELTNDFAHVVGWLQDAAGAPGAANAAAA